jgi:3-oxoacyl-[acyl-carrier-protein] synthase-3
MGIGTKIAGMGMYIPSIKVDNKKVIDLLRNQSRAYLQPNELDALIFEAEDKLEKVGSKTRYYCEQDEYCIDIALKASKAALEDAKIEAEELDMIFFTGMSKAFVEPATAHVLKHELKAKNANVLDTQDACISFIKTLELADALIKTGKVKRVLIASGERSYDWADFTCKTPSELIWKFASLTIGDGAGALVVEKTDQSGYVRDKHHFRFFYKLYSEHFNACTIGLNYYYGERYKLYSHSKKLIEVGRKATAELIQEVFSNGAWKAYKYDNLIFHNVGNIVDGLIEQMLKDADAYIEGKSKAFFPNLGNIGSASLPVALCLARQEKKLKRGNRVFVIVPAAGVQCGIMSFRY